MCVYHQGLRVKYVSIVHVTNGFRWRDLSRECLGHIGFAVVRRYSNWYQRLAVSVLEYRGGCLVGAILIEK